MNKIVLVDGNNLLFRSYYATAYSGNFMNNSKGFPTNGLYGLVNMLNKIIKEEQPEYMLVAFDKGKTFRHDKYKEYKEGRIKMPEDLGKQFVVAKELLPKMGIKCFEIDNYEADDIIGSYAKIISETNNEGLIVSSDKDLLQLIDKNNTVKLLKSKDYIMMTPDTFKEEYGIEPIKMIDLKGLMGDPSDNIPGVKGIGEKTALKLLQTYGSIEELYEHIDELKGSTKDKLVEGKESAFMSKEIATIYKEVPLKYTLDDLKYDGPTNELEAMYKELEFYSFLKDINSTKPVTKVDSNVSISIVNDINAVKVNNPVSIYLELTESNYHNADIYGLSIYDGKNGYFIPKDILVSNKNFINLFETYTYDLKKTIVALNEVGINYKKCAFDTNLASFILDYNVKDDISYIASEFGYDIKPYDSLIKDKELTIEKIASEGIKKCKFIFETKERLEKELEESNSYDLFKKIEMKLSYVLASMEIEGVRVDKDELHKRGDLLDKRINELSKEIYELSGEEFNIQSPKQLSDMLFVKMNIPYPKKNAKSYSTAREILDKLVGIHPIIEKIIDYRTLTKLYNTYIVGIDNLIKEDSKLHTIYTQTLTRTGRLSSIEPNLQNIPIRYEEGKLIRKAFIPEDNSIFISSDYSQIELRVFASMANEESMIKAFNDGMDIHTKTAMEIFNKPKEDITKNMRRQAKAVNFGILYGISNFGLSEDIGISVKDAKVFMDRYLEVFPKIKEFQDKLISDAYKNGYVLTLFNRKRKIDELNNTNYLIRQQGERMALNTPVQGTAADIIKIAMINIFDEFNKRDLKSKMILQIHDELIFNVVNEEKDIVREIIKDKMESAFKLKVPLIVDIEEGTNWYDCK